MSDLTDEQKQALYDALHGDIDGDFLVGADGWGEDIGMQHAGAGDLTRWAVNAIAPAVAAMLTEARRESWTLGRNAGIAAVIDREVTGASVAMTEPSLTEDRRQIAQTLLHTMLSSGYQPNSGDLAIAQTVALDPVIARMTTEAFNSGFSQGSVAAMEATP